MAYYFSGPPVAAIPQAVSDKPGLYGTYNGHIAAPPMPIPTQRTTAMTGAPFIQGPSMPQPGGPPPIGLAGASPITAPSPLTATTPGASPLQPGASPMHPGSSQMPPGSGTLQPGANHLPPGTSPLQPPGANPYPVSVSSSAPTYMNALPSGMYATSPGLYQGATIAYPQPAPAPPPSMAPPTMPPNQYIGRPITPYSAQGTPLPSMPVMQPPCTQTLIAGPGYGVPQGPTYTSQGYGVAPMPAGAVLAYAPPSQAPHMVHAGALSSPYPQVMSQGLAGPVPPGASYPRAPSMP